MSVGEVREAIERGQAATGRQRSAVRALRAGKAVLMLHSGPIEVPHFFLLAAELATPESLSRLFREAQGLTYLALPAPRWARLGIQETRKSDAVFPRFMESIDAKAGIGAGMSAVDRIHTIKTAISVDTRPTDLVQPGHVYPLAAEPDGVLGRAGPTEAAVDLARMSGLEPAVVMCAALGQDGELADAELLRTRWADSEIVPISADDIVESRWNDELLVLPEVEIELPTAHGSFQVRGYRERTSGRDHLAFLAGDLSDGHDILVSCHAECLLGAGLYGTGCDCRRDLDLALRQIASTSGVVIYSPRPLADRARNPFACCAQAAASGGAPSPDDPRVARQILRDIGVKTVRSLNDALRSGQSETIVKDDRL